MTTDRTEQAGQLLSKCAVCGLVGRWNKCGGCHLVAYCSKDHQKSHWKTHHKLQCSPMKLAVSPELGRHYVAARKLKMGEIVVKEDPILKFPLLESNPDVCLGCYSRIRTIDPDCHTDRVVTDDAVTGDTSPPSSEITVEPSCAARSSNRCCSGCGWPVCSQKCELSSEHSAECQFLKQFGKIDDSSIGMGRTTRIWFRDDGMDGRFGKLAAVIRTLVLAQNSDKKAWETLLDLEAHLEERSHKDSEFWESHCQILHFLRETIDITSLEASTNGLVSSTNLSDLVAKILGTIEVNCFQLSNNTNVFGMYPRAAIMEHSCHPNVAKVYDSEGRLYLRVLRPVKKGEHLAHCYTEPLWGKLARRFHLRTTKFFDCHCARCDDPTELGTHFNAIKCPICMVGYVEPNTSSSSVLQTCPANECNNSITEQEVATRWQCTEAACPSRNGEKEQDPGLLEDVSTTVLEEIKALDHKDIVGFETFLETYSPVLHPNHYCAVEAARVLSQLYGNVAPSDDASHRMMADRPSMNNNDYTSISIKQPKKKTTWASMESLSVRELRRKEQHCRKVLKVLDVLTPGSSRLKGATLFELQACLRYQALDERDIMKCLQLLKESMRTAEECMVIMDTKITGSAESAIADAAKIELQSINLHILHAKAIAGIVGE